MNQLPDWLEEFRPLIAPLPSSGPVYYHLLDLDHSIFEAIATKILLAVPESYYQKEDDQVYEHISGKDGEALLISASSNLKLLAKKDYT